MKKFALLILINVVAVATSAQPWSLAPCAQADLTRRGAVEKSIRMAPSKSLRYVPIPFPALQRDIEGNYRYWLLNHWGKESNGHLQSDQKVMLDGLAADRFRFEIVRVENWGIRRCQDPHSGDFYYLLRIFDRLSSKEFARAAMFPSGALEQTGFLSEADAPVLSLEATRESLQRQYGIAAHSAQYVATIGELRCDVLAPCIASRSKGSVYIATPRGDVFEFAEASRKFSYKDDLGNGRRAKQSLNGAGAAVSIGGDAFAAAHRVSPQSQ